MNGTSGRKPSAQDLVRQFHEVLDLPIGKRPDLIGAVTLHTLRVALIEEEVSELKKALLDGNLIEVADALADIAYVVYGAAITYGIDLDAVIAEVHRSNMTKMGEDGKPIRRADGKVLKGPRYEPPNIAAVLEARA